MEKHENATGCCGMNRRGFMRASGAAAGLACFAGLTGIGFAAPTKEEQAGLTPDAVIDLLKQGNERFRSGKMTERDHAAERAAVTHGQYPMAVVLSCIDSRVPAETVLDQGIGDMFSARVAGNIADPNLLGSMEYACMVAGSKLVVVLGHTSCGAVKGAVDQVQLGNLTGLLAKIRPAVESAPCEGERSSKNHAFVDAVARKNVELTVEDIREQSPGLKDLEDKGTIKIVGAMYDLESGAVEFI